MKIYHEAPNSIFGYVQGLTDGDYALVHMLEKSKEYRHNFFEAKRKGREIILDNSAFELGESFDMSLFVDWIYRLRPTYYVVPDRLRDAEATVGMMDKFFKTWPAIEEGTGSKSIGVVQGTTYMECVWCYEQLAPRCDVIAFNKSYGDPDDDLEVRALVRADHINKMLEDGIIDTNKPHHILGTVYPQEMCTYAKKEYSFIKSVDTCNPVVCGLLGVTYKDTGLDVALRDQPKIDDWVGTRMAVHFWPQIRYNINMFRGFCNNVK